MYLELRCKLAAGHEASLEVLGTVDKDLERTLRSWYTDDVPGDEAVIFNNVRAASPVLFRFLILYFIYMYTSMLLNSTHNRLQNTVKCRGCCCAGADREAGS